MSDDDQAGFDESEKWAKARDRYRAFREDRDGSYLLQLVGWSVPELGGVDPVFGRLALRLLKAKKEGRDLYGIVRLDEYIGVPFEANASAFVNVARGYWNFECLAHEYQKALRRRIYPDAILLLDPEHNETILSPFGKTSNRVDHEDDKLGAVFAFLSDRFGKHPHMIECFDGFRKEGVTGQDV